ncbi:hypothetical protein [Saccharothrix stipae]
MGITSSYPDGLTAGVLRLLDQQVSVEIAASAEPSSALLDGSARERRNRRILARALAGVVPRFGVSVAQAVAESEVRPRPMVTVTVPAPVVDALSVDVLEVSESGGVDTADVVAVTALAAVVEHVAEKPEESATRADRAAWWFERADLLRVLRAKVDNAFTWERVQDLVEAAETEGRRLLVDGVSPWLVESEAVA